MLKKLVTQAIKEKVGTSKVVDNIKDAYDYIIVGAGAAGNVLAARLTEDKTTSVLLLEAGGDDAQNPNVHMPVSTATLQGTSFSWNYKSEPQTSSSTDVKGQKVRYPRGRGLGGSSSINFMVYTRGSRHDFDNWANQGCTGWSYADVLPYFIKSEDNQNQQFVKTGYHGRGGPMKVSNLTMTPLVDMFLRGAQELNYNTIDLNGHNNIGFGNAQGNVYNGMRWSTAHGYLRPAMERENLDVAIGAQVQRVLMANREATGIDVTHKQKALRVHARKEIIICAGAIESPKILMLSGIGPAETLEKFQIPVIADLPVGENMQDHPMCVVEYKLDKPVNINVDNSYQLSNQINKEYQQFMFFKKGYMGIPIAQAALGFIRSRLAPADVLYPDLQIQMASSLAAALLRKTWNLEDDADLIDTEESKPGVLLSSYVLHPKSRGKVTLKSRKAGAKPAIDPNFYSHPDDILTQMEGLSTIFKMGETVPYKTMGARLSGAEIDIDNRDQLEDLARRRTLTSHHITGTCKMGPKGDATAVVDPDLQVQNIRGLRVVDASVMPEITSGATSAPTIMMAERVADIIKGSSSVSHIRVPDEILEEFEKERKVRN